MKVFHVCIQYILIHTPSMGRNDAKLKDACPAIKILIHTPSMGRNCRTCDICTHTVRRFAHYTSQRQRLAYPQLRSIYIINNPCERYGGFMCTLCSHSTVHLFIGGPPPSCMYSISHCGIPLFSVDESANPAFP